MNYRNAKLMGYGFQIVDKGGILGELLTEIPDIRCWTSDIRQETRINYLKNMN